MLNMNNFVKFYALLLILSTTSCTAQKEFNQKQAVSDTSFVNLKDYSDKFIYDMKYATSDNFLQAVVYDCGECYLRLATVRALASASEAALSQGYRLKIYDCYRPLDIQKRMWKIVPNPTYVADPAKGSIHNRGGAVDLTLVDNEGNELDMGTSFDHFGPEAAHKYQKLSESVLANRKLLKGIMELSGFSALASEWWHYNLNGSAGFPVANFKWECN